MDDLVRALGCDTGVSKSTVSRICAGIDDEIAEFRARPLGHIAMPYLYVDATYIKARVAHRIVSRAVIVATAVTMDGNREVLGVDVGDSEDEVFWTTFLRSLRERGLSGVRLVISDAHAGLKAAIARVFSGATWQRCKVHTMRNVLAAVPAASKEMVAATVRTIFAQGTPAETTAQLRQVVTILENQFPKAAETLAAAEVDVCAYATFPRAHWRKIASTNPLERINKEIKRRSNVVGIFPDDDSVIRLVGAVLVDQHDEWQATDRRYLSEGSMALIDAPTQEVTTTHLQRTHRRVTSQRTPRVTPSLPPLHSVSCWWGQREADDRAAGSLNHSVPFVARSRLATSSTMWTGRRGLIGAWYRPH